MSILSAALIAVTFLVKKKGLQNFLDIFLWSILAFLGFFWIGMWIFTDHGASYFNLNLFWTNPLFLIPIIWGGERKMVGDENPIPDHADSILWDAGLLLVLSARVSHCHSALFSLACCQIMAQV